MVKTVFLLGLIALPLVTAALDWPLWLAAVALVLLLGSRWLAVLASLTRPADGVRLETISASHFAEKVRWCMDRMGLEYHEQVWAGTLGAFYRGRTVPTLHVGRHCTIGNSADILRYLWGRYGTELGEAGEFLRPTTDRLELESRLDAYGVDLQRWVYYHLLPHRDKTLHAWGIHDDRVPAWQRILIRAVFPLHRVLIRRAFRISERGYGKARARIEALLADLDQTLQSAPTVTGEQQSTYADLTFAALSGLWLQPDAYARGEARRFSLPEEELPAGWRSDRDAWQAAYPAACGHVVRLYESR